MIIRALSHSDKNQWLPLWQGYQRFYKTEIAQAVTDKTWARFHEAAEPMFAYGAFHAEKLVGIVHIIYHRSCWTEGDYCYLQDLYVDEALRGAGVGKQLIEAVYAFAKEKGASRVHWLTHETNTDAMFLYNKIAQKPGFVQYRQILNH